MLGLSVEKEGDWFPWLIAAVLFAKPISVDIARRTIRLLLNEGVTTPEAIVECGWEGLVAILDAGGYVRYDFSTADRLLALAQALPRDRLRRIRARAPTAEALERRLTEIKGVGPKTVNVFLRELRGVWDLDLPLSEEARSAARKVGLAVSALRLPKKSLARLESVLVRTWIEHCKRGRWETCPAGDGCGCASKRGRSSAGPPRRRSLRSR